MMNKTLITLGFFVIILVGIIGLVFLLITAPDRAGDFVTMLTGLLGIGTTGVVLIYGLGTQQKTLETIKANTNGNLTAKELENQRLTDVLLAAYQAAPAGTFPSQSTGAHSA